MQLSQLYRRGIVIPLDERAEAALRAFDADESLAVRVVAIPGNVFEQIWTAGLFQEINSRCASNIDDYEEELLESAMSPHIVAAIDHVTGRDGCKRPELAAFLADFRTLASDAGALGRPILFVL